MNRKLRTVLIFGCIALIALTTLVSLRTSAATLGTRTFLPLVQRDASASALPDLLPTYAYWNMRGYHGQCMTQYNDLIIMVCLRNQGQGAAGPFSVSLNGAFGANSTGLGAGQNLCLETIAAAMPVTIVVDSANQVAESDESNNTWAGLIPIPTPPVLCTPTPTPSPTPSVTATPSPTSCPDGMGPDGIGGCPVRASQP